LRAALVPVPSAACDIQNIVYALLYKTSLDVIYTLTKRKTPEAKAGQFSMDQVFLYVGFSKLICMFHIFNSLKYNTYLASSTFHI